ncbi:MAG: ATP synthase subunit I [Lachnospiraceae bacterium]
MKKLGADVKKTIRFIAIGTVILTLIMFLAFLISGHFNLLVLCGGLVGALLAVFNFFLLAKTLQKAADKGDASKAMVGVSYTSRMVMLVVAAILAVWIFHLNPIAVILPYTFPRISIWGIGFLNFKNSKQRREGGQKKDES